MAKTTYIECDGHLVYTMFGDRYELASGKHKVEDVVPAIGGTPGESDAVVKQRIAQKIKTSYPQKITLSVEYDADSVVEPVVETAVEAASPMPEKPAPEPEKPKAKPAAKPAAKKAVKAKK